MHNFSEKTRKYKKYRNSKWFSKVSYVYRLIRWGGSLEISKQKIYEMISLFYGDIEKTEKKKIYRDARKFCLENGLALDNYFKFNFYGLTKNERKKYSVETPMSLRYAWGYFNDYDYYYLFNDKYEFYKRFKRFFRRDVFLGNKDSNYNEFVSFCNLHKEVFVKPKSEKLGRNAGKYDVSTVEKIDAVWEIINNSEDGYMVEEVIVAEKSLAEFHPNSVNALRIVTVLVDGKPEILCAYVRFGNGGRPIEHIYTGAVGASIDVVNGIVCTQAVDQYNNLYTLHPYSNKRIVGYKFKNWDQCISLVKEMALVVPQIRFVGWDVVINENEEWIVIEGNHDCGFEVAQTTMHKGLQQRLDKIIENEEYING